MTTPWMLVTPRILPPLDPDFRPAVLCNRSFREAVCDVRCGQRLVLGMERGDGQI